MPQKAATVGVTHATDCSNKGQTRTGWQPGNGARLHVGVDVILDHVAGLGLAPHVSDFGQGSSYGIDSRGAPLRRLCDVQLKA
eukprot:scaffold43064_cov38-Prasinocladus_malaysianus.AAC.1